MEINTTQQLNLQEKMTRLYLTIINITIISCAASSIIELQIRVIFDSSIKNRKHIKCNIKANPQFSEKAIL